MQNVSRKQRNKHSYLLYTYDIRENESLQRNVLIAIAQQMSDTHPQ